ncbi:hypothetical protein CC80DRAFT_536431 [Byssothecium circinans]|uniref:Uncharacterized protein n=1 Tax=Byssothecium circinans TaxID=147558 RepID=A0A6A5TTD0_9PLEO|nr:hypothetical protein CC80DRAFT_536431 [Byssothecium circinans]
MPGPRNLPARSSLRRNAPKEEEAPMQTRSGRGTKSAAKPEKPDIVSPRTTKQSFIEPPLTRKGTRTTSTVSNYAKLDSAPDVYATYESPYFMVFGLTPEFFDTIKEQKGTRKSKQNARSELPALNTLFTHTEEEESSSSDSEESDEPVPARPVVTRGRGRGRGSRGGRGRGGRGRGSRGGRGRGASVAARTTSPLRTRPSRTAAPVFPLTEEDDEEPSNQGSPMVDAKTSPEPEAEDVEQTAAGEQSQSEHEDDGDDEDTSMKEDQDDSFSPVTPPGNPPPTLVEAYNDPSMSIPVPTLPTISKPSLAKDSPSATPKGNASPPSETALPTLLLPEEDMLSDSDLHEPWIEDQPVPMEAECEDRADFLLKTRYKPLTDVSDIIASLTKYPISQRSTESLYALAENTQTILKAWQDQYLELDAKTAPHAHPPKKPCNGGRIPMDHQQFEGMKEADLYGYNYDPKKLPEAQDPFAQRPGHEKSGGRELRQRRTRDMLDSAAPSEEEEEEGDESRSTKRQRRATRPFESSDQGTGTNTPKKKHNGWGGARKKGVSKYAKPTASATPEPEAQGRGKRTKTAHLAVHSRIQEIRGESAVASSGDEGSDANSGDADEQPTPPHQKRGRPAGSKNVGRRSDYGQKKGPRKRMHEEEVDLPARIANLNAQLAMLKSMSEGQGQFTIDAPVGTSVGKPVAGLHATETVFQATPQPPGITEPANLERSVKAQTPDTYMNTTPLSQYGTPYADDSGANSASGSRKKPRVKSEKRSQSMTIWWAERKARQKELDEKSGTPLKSTSRSSSSTGRRGGRGGRTSDTHPRPTSSHHEPGPQYAPQLNPQEMYSVHQVVPPPPHSYSASSPTEGYITYPHPPGMLMQSPLTALPSGSSAGPPPPPPPPPPPSSAAVNAQGRALAPAPQMPPQLTSYPSPFGPRTAPRPKSNGPPPLAPAPAAPPIHVSPYGPSPPGPQTPVVREMPFKIMVPGPPPSQQQEGRRESR